MPEQAASRWPQSVPDWITTPEAADAYAEAVSLLIERFTETSEEDVLRLLSTAIDNFPDNQELPEVLATIVLGMVDPFTGVFESAAQLFERRLVSNPNDAFALTSAVELYTKSMIGTVETKALAFEYAVRAFQLTPTDYSLQLLVWTAVDAHKEASALATIEEAQKATTALSADAVCQARNDLCKRGCVAQA